MAHTPPRTPSLSGAGTRGGDGLERLGRGLRLPGRRRMLVFLGFELLGLCLAWLVLPRGAAGLETALSLHTLFEMVPMAVAAAVFAVGWEATLHGRPTPLAILAAGFLGVAALDFLHALSTPGMPGLVGTSTEVKAQLFWYSARLLAAVTLLLVGLVPWGSAPQLGHRRAWLLGSCLLVAVACAVVLPGPPAWLAAPLEGPGAATWRVGLEATLIACYLFAGLLLWKSPQPVGGLDLALLAVAAWTMAMAESFFVHGQPASLAFAVLGHLYKAAALGLLYTSVVRHGLRAPYHRLAESERRLEALVHEREAVFDDLSRHSWSLVEVNQMSELLLTCRDETEAFKIISRAGGRLFAARGFLAVERPDLGVLDATASWGDWGTELRQHIAPDTCWSLRRGQPHLSGQGGDGLPCLHALSQADPGGLCVPLVVQGRLLGLLHVGLPATSRSAPDDIQGAWRQLVEVFGAAIKSTLSNLRLRTSLHEQATHDPLTRLYNRRSLDETLPRELHRSLRAREPLSVAMIDVDHFKLINDRFGHEAGDVVLEGLGRMLREHLRFSDVACRFGGEEFVVVMPGTHATQAQSRLEQLRVLVSEFDFTHLSRKVGPVTVSVGIAQAPLHGVTRDELVKKADEALYRAKAEGRNRTVIAGAAAPAATLSPPALGRGIAH